MELKEQPSPMRIGAPICFMLGLREGGAQAQQAHGEAAWWLGCACTKPGDRRAHLPPPLSLLSPAG